jgi:hypothetical protein
MFIKKLYRHSKMGCFVFVAFTMAFIFINYKWGVVATPVFQYGMFSTSFYLKDTQTAYRIYVNDQEIDLTKYAFAKRDMLLVLLENYEKEKIVNTEVFLTMRQLLKKTGVGYLMKQAYYSNNINDTTFTVWHKKLLEKMLGYPVVNAAVFRQKVILKNSVVQPVSSPEKIPFLVAN